MKLCLLVYYVINTVQQFTCWPNLLTFLCVNSCSTLKHVGVKFVNSTMSGHIVIWCSNSCCPTVILDIITTIPLQSNRILGSWEPWSPKNHWITEIFGFLRWNIERTFTSPHLSRVWCHMSGVTCHMSRVTCHMSSITFFCTTWWG